MNILITGCAGFIGFHLSQLLNDGKNKIIGIDNLNKYYDIKLKLDRLNILKKKNNQFIFYKVDLNNKKKIDSIFKKHKLSIVVHLAAQAGVRYSINNPSTYAESNLIGFFNILDMSKKYKIKHLMAASTSSVYGESSKFPSNEDDTTDKPLSFYSATKKSNEIMAYSYAYLYKIPTTVLRFFTVYGPYGRPDMSLFKFVNSIINNKKIELYNNGNHVRDFTYIDDAVVCVKKLISKIPSNRIPYKIFNIASNKPVKLKKFLKLIELNLNKKAKIKYMKLQAGDIYKTHASNKKLSSNINYAPNTDIENGIKIFIKWYKTYYGHES